MGPSVKIVVPSHVIAAFRAGKQCCVYAIEDGCDYDGIEDMIPLGRNSDGSEIVGTLCEDAKEWAGVNLGTNEVPLAYLSLNRKITTCFGRHIIYGF